jgi:hypothetical protein
MEIELEIGNHCIQASAKQVYERMLNRHIKGEIPDDMALILEKQIEGIIFFLKYADFSYLRSTYSDLDGRRRHRVILDIPQHFEEMKLKWDNQKISPQWKQYIKDQSFL